MASLRTLNRRVQRWGRYTRRCRRLAGMGNHRVPEGHIRAVYRLHDEVERRDNVLVPERPADGRLRRAPVPGRAAVTPAEADWVYDVVLTRRYKESAGAIMWTGARENRRDEGPGPRMLRMCACSFGLCGRCSGGRPDLCSHRAWTPGVSPEGYIQDRAGNALNRVWMKGRPCSWLCPTVRLGQLELFAAGGAR